jgi:hypothetical protein
MATGFVYCWSDNKTAKVYVGIHCGAIDDGYVCSSKDMLHQYKQRPDDFSRQILFTGDYNICASYEVALIKGLFKTNKETFYNRSAGKKILFDEDIKKKISVALLGNKNGLNQDGPWKGLSSPRKGQKHTEEAKKKMSESRLGRVSPNKGKTFSAEHKEKLSIAHTGKVISETHRKALSEASKKSWIKRKAQKISLDN